MLREVFQTRHVAVVTQLLSGVQVEVTRIRELITELARLREFGGGTLTNTLPRLRDIVAAAGEILLHLLETAIRNGALTVKLERLRFVNIETPVTPTSGGQTNAQLLEES